MAQDMVETFARGLIDQIVLEAFDQIKFQSKKEVSYTHMQHSDTFIDYKGRNEKELIGNTIHDLRGVQIGDTSYLLSSSMSVLEQRQSRRAACFIDNTSIENASISVVEMSDIQGQGDVEPIAFDSESSKKKRAKSMTCNKETDQPGVNDATKISTNLLHRMIEELETVTEETITNPNDADIYDEKSKEDIAAWEEKEEKLIRIIEDTEGSHDSITEESRSIRQFNVDDDREELKSSMMMSGASSSRNLSFDEVYIEENTSDYQQTQQRRISIDEVEESHDFFVETKDTDEKTNSKKKKKKKKNKESFGQRLKRFFLKRFKRGKN
ncbi:uncharacterized protein LOC122513984 [Polistes fuscatus]|uniref:uncharacterized protein LOC122513984 n=1 Tax=Polistes fuscatus TaxID=30207 RepID=UPI001CA7D2E2|nr:uncharacterized protein LOC122513984 [Polistes fuscatus]